MRRYLVPGLMLATAAMSFTGCTTYRPISWNPFAWNQPATTSVATKSANPPAANYDFSKSASDQNQNWLTSAWKSTTDTLSAPFKAPEKEDPLALSTESKPNSELYAAVGEMQKSSGNYPAAVAQFDKALQLDSNDLKSRVGLARLYDSQKETAKALAQYEKALEAHPNSPLVHNDLGLFYANQKQVDKSILELEQAVRLDAANPLYRNNLATVLIERGRDDEAFAHLGAVNPPAVAHYNFACLLHTAALREAESFETRQRSAQHNETAVSELQTALRLDPSISAASALLAKLQPQGPGSIANREGIPAAPAAYPSNPVYR